MIDEPVTDSFNAEVEKAQAEVDKKVVKLNKVVKKAIKKAVKKLAPKIKTKVKKAMKPVTKHLKKRGPKGAQWRSWKIPYQTSCTMGQLFLECMKKGGMKINDILKYANKRGANTARVIRYLKSGHSKGWIWEVDDSNNRIRVSRPRIGDKNWKK